MTTVGVFALFSLYEVVTVPVYIRIIFVLAKNKSQFGTPFYRLLIFIGILDLFGFMLRFIFYRLPIFQLTQHLFANSTPTYWFAPIRFNAFFLNSLLFLCQLGLSANRFTGAWIALEHDKIWKRWHIYVSICAIVCFCLNFNLLFASARFNQLMAGDDAKGFILVPVDNNFPINYDPNLMTFIIGTGCWVCSLLLNILTLIKIVAMKRRGNLSLQESKHIAINLSIIAAWTTLDTAVYTGYQATGFIIVAIFQRI